MRSNMTRRQLMQGIAAAVPMVVTASTTHGLTTGSDTAAGEDEETDQPRPYPEGVLPHGVRSRFVNGINGLRMHVLEAGYEGGIRPGVLLLHGFPELAYGWRKRVHLKHQRQRLRHLARGNRHRTAVLARLRLHEIGAPLRGVSVRKRHFRAKLTATLLRCKLQHYPDG
jgi:hypothetical protein